MTRAVRLAALRPLLSQTTRAAQHEQCELCRAPLPQQHSHVVNVRDRRLICTCAACAATAQSTGSSEQPAVVRTVPAQLTHQQPRTIAADEWAALDIPVDIVFIFLNSSLGRPVACYPGPAGATESLLALDGWHALVNAHGWLKALVPDVEALLVRRIEDRCECFVVPIDRCYELVGRIRTAWTGFGGGDRVRDELRVFFDSLVAAPAGVSS